MKLEQINNYLKLLDELYWYHASIETMADVYIFIKFFNKDFNKLELKRACFFILERILSENSHYFHSNNFENSITFSKNNIKEGIDFMNKYWDVMVMKIETKDIDSGIFLKDGSVVDVMPYLYWTEEWKNELCKLSKIGYQNGMSYKCKLDDNYKYQMPKQRFIPKNDCGCEE